MSTGEYNVIGPFVNGLALATTKFGDFLHVRPGDTPAYEQRWDCAGTFAETDHGMWACARKGCKCFLIDPKGEKRK